MVRIFIILILMAVFYTAGSQNMTGNTSIIPESYSSSNDQPLLFRKGRILKVECDSIYVLNSQTFNYFKNIREVLSTPGLDCSEVIELYKNTLIENALLTEKLLLNARETGELDQKRYTATRESLNSAQESVKVSIEKLELASRSLDNANKQVVRMKRKSNMEKILFGIGGIGIGILAGISIN